MAKAYTELDRAGFIRTARGIGTHVLGQVDEQAIQASRTKKLQSTIEATVQELKELGYTLQEIGETFAMILKE